MSKLIALVFLICLTRLAWAGGTPETIKITDDLQLIKVSDNAWVHVSYMNGDARSGVPCNGLLLIDGDKAFLFDTPHNDSLTQILLAYIKNTLKLQVVGFISNDWHRDSMGGLKAVQAAGIPSYAHEMTRKIARKKKLPVAQWGFKDSLALKLGDKAILCYYLGPAHTKDNIVVWLPTEQVLFADCMVKELVAKDLGYTDDGDLKAYPKTLEKVKAKFAQARVVIPGHGACGGIELIEHNLKLAKKTR